MAGHNMVNSVKSIAYVSNVSTCTLSRSGSLDVSYSTLCTKYVNAKRTGFVYSSLLHV